MGKGRGYLLQFLFACRDCRNSRHKPAWISLSTSECYWKFSYILCGEKKSRYPTVTASSTIQENPVNLSHLLRNTCPLFLLLMLRMETKQFNFVCANVLLWRDVARRKTVCEGKTSNCLSNMLVLLGERTWGVLIGQVPERCRRILHHLRYWGWKGIFTDYMRFPGLFSVEVSLSPEKCLWTSVGSSVRSPDVGSGGEALLPPEKGLWSPWAMQKCLWRTRLASSHSS